jgi:fructose-1,6-bisphosphatase/inositol monophosphatase family enzyme
MENISKVVRIAGLKIMDFAEQVKDTQEFHGHSSSTIDAHAEVVMTGTFAEVYERHRRSLGDWAINLEYEDAAAWLAAAGYFPTEEERAAHPVAIIDEIDGTTNVKRAVAAPLLANKNPKSAVCIALKRTRDSSDIECGAIYAIDADCVFAGMRAEKDYIAFRERELINRDDCVEPVGDGKYRIIVPCYSNRHHAKCAELQEAIESRVNEGMCECYGGCRSSTIDVIDIIRNQYDAYVDCRELWTGEEDLKTNSVLRVYDVAATIPIARGAGLKVVTPRGEEFSSANTNGRDPLSVIIGRPQAVEQVVRAIERLLDSLKPS